MLQRWYCSLRHHSHAKFKGLVHLDITNILTTAFEQSTCIANLACILFKYSQLIMHRYLKKS